MDFRIEIDRLCRLSVPAHRTCGPTESCSPTLPLNSPLGTTPLAQMGSRGLWTCSRSALKMGGTWPVSTWASSPSSASWCPRFREFVFETCCSCAQPSSRAQPSMSLPACRQYYSSCKTGNMDSAISIWFLLLWLGGDSCNLVGSFLADQLPLQVSGGVLVIPGHNVYFPKMQL